MVDVLLKDATTQVDVNGVLFEEITLERSIHQGCPLASALFIISSDALSYLLRDHSLSPRIKWISLPDDNELVNVQFVDDTSLFIELFKENMDALMRKLDLFSLASRAKISNSKSIMLGWKGVPSDWLKEYGFQWGGPGM